MARGARPHSGGPRGGAWRGKPIGRPGETYIEFVALGNMVRVIAVDAATGTEVTIVGPANAARADLERVALRKLRMVLARR